MKRKLDRIFIHWPGTTYPEQMSDEQILMSIQRQHKLKWSDIGYSFAVGQDGRKFDLRGLNVAGGHTRTENDDSYGILVIINVGESPTSEALRGVMDLIEHIRLHHDSRGPLNASDIRVMGHRRDVLTDGAGTATQCPGPDLDKWAWEYVHGRDYEVEYDPPATAMPFNEAAAFLDAAYRLTVGPPDTVGFNYWRDRMIQGSARKSDVLFALADVLKRAGQ